MKKLLNKYFATAAVLLGCFSGHLSFSQTYTLSGTAVDYGNGLIRMTASQATSAQSASIWSTTKHDLTQPFDMSFDMFYGCNNNTATGGDGMTFTFQNESANALGAGFGFLGIGGNPTEMITPAISIEFDTFDGSGGGGSNELPADHIAIDINGNVNNTNVFFDGTAGSVTSQAILSGRDLEDCAANASNYFTIRIVWDPTTTTLRLYEEGTLTMTYNSDLVNTVFGGSTSVYWGFTAATGTASNEQWIAPAGSIIPWDCKTLSCCTPFDLTQTGPSTICNNPIQIGVTDTYSSYKWSTGATTSTIDVSTPGFYSLTVLDNNGCPAIDTFTIAPTGPTASIAGNATICSDGTTSTVNVTLTGNDPWKFVYSIDGVKQDTVTTSTSPYSFQGTAPNVYSLDAVIDNSGCNGQTSGTATIAAYAALPTGHDTIFYAPGPAELNVTDGGGTYDWYADASGGSPVFTGPQYIPTLTETTTFYVEDASIPAFVTKSVGLLDINDPAAIGSSANNPGAQAMGLPRWDCWLDFTANSNFTLERVTCAINVLAGTWTNSRVTIYIDDQSNGVGDDYTQNSDVNTALTAGVQNLLVPVSFACVAGRTYRISYEANASIQTIMYWNLVTVTPTPYHLTSDAEIDITQNSGQTQRYPGLFDWQISVGSPAANCGRTPVTAFACGDLAVGNNITYVAPSDIELTVDDDGGIYRWYTDSTGSTLVNTGTSYSILNASGTHKYYVEHIVAGRVVCGRTPITATPTTVTPPPTADVPLFIPNLMTPNKDGKNDLFEIKGLPDNSKLQIFNRWGVKVYANEAYNNTWAADNQSDGMYFFDLLLEEGTAYKGWVQIVR